MAHILSFIALLKSLEMAPAPVYDMNSPPTKYLYAVLFDGDRQLDHMPLRAARILLARSFYRGLPKQIQMAVKMTTDLKYDWPQLVTQTFCLLNHFK